MTRERFIELVKQEQNSLRGFLLALCCGNKSDADDIAQDALVKAYLALGQYSDRGQFRAWLFRIAYNTFLNYEAAKHNNESLEEVVSITNPTGSDDAFRHQALYMALDKLPSKERAAVTLYYMNGYSIKEIAGITGDKTDAVKKQLSRGRENLKEMVKL